MKAFKYTMLMMAFLAVGLGAGWLFSSLVNGGSAAPSSEVRSVDRAAVGLPADKDMVMISLSTCPVCAEARSWLAKEGIAHHELVVDKSDDAKRIADRLKLESVPVFIVGDRQITGFNVRQIESELSSSTAL
jgi:glutaredoxin 3